MSVAAIACDLCGLPVPPNGCREKTSGRTLVFCCEGCRRIWLMLNADSELPPRASEDAGQQRRTR